MIIKIDTDTLTREELEKVLLNKIEKLEFLELLKEDILKIYDHELSSNGKIRICENGEQFKLRKVNERGTGNEY